MNLLITGAWQGAKTHFADLRAQGHQIRFLPFEADGLDTCLNADGQAFPCSYDWVEGIVGNGIFLHHPITKFPNLRFIQVTSAGLDRVPMEVVKKRNIPIFNARGVYHIPMAEYAVSGVLQCFQNSRMHYENQAKHAWMKNREVLELTGKTVAILGCGSVGTACAVRFHAMGCRTVGVEIALRQDPAFDEMRPWEELDAALMAADVLILSVPLTGQTKGLMNAERFGRLKDGAVLVNISRGGVVETEALLAHVGRLCGAVLDVFEEEPLGADSPLWDLENVIITPHNSFVGEGNDRRLAAVILQNLQSQSR